MEEAVSGIGGGGPLGGGIDGGKPLYKKGLVGLRNDRNGRDDLYCLGGVTLTVAVYDGPILSWSFAFRGASFSSLTDPPYIMYRGEMSTAESNRLVSAIHTL